MRLFPLCLALFLSACRVDYDVALGAKDNGEDLDGTNAGVEVETGSTVPEDTDIIVPDTATEEANCAFPTVAWVAGSEIDVILENELEIALCEGGASSDIEPTWNDVLCLEFTAVHPECPALTIPWHGVYNVWTDMEETEWYWDMLYSGLWGYSDDGELLTSHDLTVYNSDVEDNFVFGMAVLPDIAGGSTLRVTYLANLEGASTEWDDSVMFGLEVDQLGIVDANGDIVGLYVEPLDGPTLTL